MGFAPESPAAERPTGVIAFRIEDGVGMLVGFSAAGAIADRFNVNGHHDWFQIWIYPAAFAALILVLFALLFRNEAISYQKPQ